MRKFIFLLIAGLFLTTAGCGYTTGSTLPKSIRTIHIEDFKNNISYTDGRGQNIYLPLLEVDVRNAIIDRFLFDGHLKIADPEDADLVLKGRLISYDRGGLRYSDNNDVEEYRIQITVSLEMWNTKYEEVEWKETSFIGEAEYFVTGSEASSETDAINRAITDLARRLVERTIEAW